MKAIDIDNLTKKFNNQKGIFNISMKIEQGEVVGFLGPNGAGKTTTIRHILGFLFPKEGSVLVDGLDVSDDMETINRKIGYLPGEIAFMDEMNGYSFIKFIAKMKKVENLDKANELIEYFELNPKGKIKKMSKGMKQKLGIVCALLHDPSILVLDEPTSGLDPLMQKKFVDLILHEKAKGKTIFISSHNFEEIERTCDRVIYIKEGRIIDDANIEMLRKDKRKIFEVEFMNTEMVNEFKKNDFKIIMQQDNVIKVELYHDINNFIKVLAKYEVVSLIEDKLSLEEMFIHYYGVGEKYND